MPSGICTGIAVASAPASLFPSLFCLLGLLGAELFVFLPDDLHSLIAKLAVRANVKFFNDADGNASFCNEALSLFVIGNRAIVPLVAKQQEVGADLGLSHIGDAAQKIVNVKLEGWWFAHKGMTSCSMGVAAAALDMIPCANSLVSRSTAPFPSSRLISVATSRGPNSRHAMATLPLPRWVSRIASPGLENLMPALL
jgi:hypothetical protein